MRLTQGTFSYLPDFTDEEIAAQVRYSVDNGWALAVEYTDDPHPRNVYWEMWGLPYFDIHDVEAVVGEVNRCRQEFPDQYIRLSAYDAKLGRQTTALAFIVNRPKGEPGFRLNRTEGPGRTLAYTMDSYAARAPQGSRYNGNGNGNGSAA
jgi:ribulose-bisphosphate carboxylase small chain